MAARVFFPDYTAEIFTAVLEICLDERFEVLVMRGVNVCTI
jgi:hypothetical protein